MWPELHLKAAVKLKGGKEIEWGKRELGWEMEYTAN